MNRMLLAVALAFSSACADRAWRPEEKPIPAVQVGVTTYPQLEREIGQPWRLLMNFDGSYRAIYISHVPGSDARIAQTLWFDPSGTLVASSPGEDERPARTAMSSAVSSNGAM